MSKSTEILIVEDSDDDFEAAQAALSHDNNFANQLVRCEGGDEALDYLFGRGDYSGAAKPKQPSMVLLDLNLPGTDGREVLRTIKSDPVLKVIPVIVMTTSEHEDDIDSCYRDGANSYIVKPIGTKVFFEALSRLRDYWFEIVVLPRPS